LDSLCSSSLPLPASLEDEDAHCASKTLNLTSRATREVIVKIIPPHDILELLLTQVGVDEMLSLRTSYVSMNFSCRAPAKITSHFPVNKTYNLIMANNAIRWREIVMRKACILVNVGRE
jgi:hypothetical protein